MDPHTLFMLVLWMPLLLPRNAEPQHLFGTSSWGGLVLDLGWGPKKVSKGRFTHGPRAMTLKVQSPLKITPRSYRGKTKSKFELTGPQA